MGEKDTNNGTLGSALAGAGFSAPRISRAISTFVVGFVAGTAPFILIYCLPALLTPGSLDTDIPFMQLLLIGLVVGLTTSIIFTEQVTKKWQDVFVYALGIPALLIATVGDISGRLDTNAFQARISSEVLAPSVTPATIEGKLEIVPVSVDDNRGNNTLGFLGTLVPRAAAAAQPDSVEQQVPPAGKEYLVAIGTYSDKEKAIRDYRKYQEKTFKTQSYFNKSLGLVKISNQYLIVYWRGSDRNLAEKVYKLLRINDPEVPVQLYQN